MKLNYSTGLVNALADSASAQAAAGNGKLYLFGGTMPASADTASGTSPLNTVTKGGAAFTGETQAAWQFTLSGTVGGTVGPVQMSAGPFAAATGGLDLLAGTTVVPATGLSETALAVAAAINLKSVFSASASGAVVTVKAPIGSGVLFNSTTIEVTGATITVSEASAGAATTAGVAAVNACNFDGLAASGIITSSETWNGNATLAGTATWFRYVTDNADTGTGASSVYRRIDGDITTIGGGGALELSTTTMLITPSATPVAITGFQLEMPMTYTSL